MITVKVEGLDDVRRMLGDLQHKLPSVIARACTETAKDAQKEVKSFLPRMIDKPTPFIMNSVRVVAADKRKPRIEAAVGFAWFRKNLGINDFSAPMAMRSQVYGGSRERKASERRLINDRVMPSGDYLVPAKGAKLDRYGNVPGSFVNRVLYSGVRFGSASEGFAKALNDRKNTRHRRGVEYFVMMRGKQRVGIYQRRPDAKPMPVFLFVNKANYRQRFPFDAIVNRVVARQLNIRVNESINVVLNKYR